MIFIIVSYFVLPLTLASLLIRWLKKRSPAVTPADVRESLERTPLEKRWFRALRRDHKGVHDLGDFETHVEAVDCAYKGKEKAVETSHKAQFLIVNHKGEILEEVDS